MVLREYYRVVPEIVKAVNARPDAQAIWEEVYRKMVAVCADLILTGKYEQAYEAYKFYTLSLAGKML